MKITRLYSTPDGESHFEDVYLRLINKGEIGRVSDPIKTESIMFRETDGDYNYDWHNAPRKQYIVMLGQVDIEVSDGEKRGFNLGDIVLVEDTTGKGHKSKAVDGQPRESIFIALEEQDG